MNGAILIYGGSLKNRIAKAKELVQNISDTNILEVEIPSDRKSIGIEQVRQAITFINKKPFLNDRKSIIVTNADKMTTDAQNALLKTLEEPPSYALIIMCAKTEESLLPTVISRCQRLSAYIKEGRVGESRLKTELEKLKKMSVDEKFTWSQEKAKEEKEDIIETLESWIAEERESLGQNLNSANNLKTILQVKADLENTNVNTRLALDFLLLNLL